MIRDEISKNIDIFERNIEKYRMRISSFYFISTHTYEKLRSAKILRLMSSLVFEKILNSLFLFSIYPEEIYGYFANLGNSEPKKFDNELLKYINAIVARIQDR